MSTPCSLITLYKIPALSPTYRDSYYFADVTAQNNFFSQVSNPKTLSPKQITRISDKQVKVPYPCEEIREYNYMKIVNQRWGENDPSVPPTGKTFYCFIVDVEYVADMCCLITYEVDVIQTYLIQSTLGQAFVVRKHSDSDEKFEHREPEPFSVQNYTSDKQESQQAVIFVVLGITAGTKIKPDGTNEHTCLSHLYQLSDSSMGGGSIRVYSGSEYWIFDPYQDYTILKNILKSLEGHEEAITDFYCVPQESYWGTTGGEISETSSQGSSTSWTPSTILPRGGVSGYTPDNNKLYNYPYCFIRVQNNLGDYMDLKFEEFEEISGSRTYSFEIFGTWFGGGAETLYPKNYEGIKFSEAGTYLTDVNRNYMLPINTFPYCPYKSDAYAQWKAQKQASELTSASFSSLGGIIAGIGISAINPIAGGFALMSAGGRTISNFGQLIAEDIEANKKPNTINNNRNNSCVPLTNNMFGYTATKMSLSYPEAVEIDNYFTMFGYAYNKILDLRSYMNNSKRSKFFYIKTSGLSVKGNYPSVYKDKINAIFDNGITFWKPTATVGDYSQNTIVP